MIIIRKIAKYDDGICLEKKEKVRKKGAINQKKFFLNKIPSAKEYKVIKAKITE